MDHTVVLEVVVMAAALPQVLWVVPDSTEIQPVIFVIMLLSILQLQYAPNLLRMEA